jgi:AcrR family transcriptional regulator
MTTQSSGHYNKGIRSRKEILELARVYLNNEGISVTIGDIAQHLEITHGKFSHHFPTKDALFIGIAKEYECRLTDLIKETAVGSRNFTEVIELFSLVLDLQAEFRCIFFYIAAKSARRDPWIDYNSQTFEQNRQVIVRRLKQLVAAGVLSKSILLPAPLEIFIFQYTNLLTTWFINAVILYPNYDFAQIKPIVLGAVISTYQPYITEKGLKEVRKALKAKQWKGRS